MGGDICFFLGFFVGLFFCVFDCIFDILGCEDFLCGDGVVLGDEVCDGGVVLFLICVSLGFDYGMVGCFDDCVVDVVMCGRFFCCDVFLNVGCDESFEIEDCVC